MKTSFRQLLVSCWIPLAMMMAIEFNAGAFALSKKDTLARKGVGMSIRTNLLLDGLAEPNLGLEFAVGDHFSVGVDAGIKPWPRWLAWDNDTRTNTSHWRNFVVAPEFRYYLSEVFNGFFTGADFDYIHYNVGNVQLPFGLYPEVRDHRVQGSFFGAGLFVGYAWWPWQHWRLELEAGAAVGLAAYGRYDCPHCGSKLSDEKGVAWVPKLALNLAYNPIARDKRPPRSQTGVAGKDTLSLPSAPVAFVVQLREVSAPQTVGDSLARNNSWVAPIERYRPFDYQSRPGKDNLQYVSFPLGSHRLDLSLGRNASALDSMQRVIELLREDEHINEILVSVVGLASIEGSQVRNDSLSLQRARAVADYLKEKTFISRRFFDVIGKGEAWDWFKSQLEDIPEGGAGLSAEQVQYLLDLIRDEADADERERRIKADPGLFRKVADSLLADQRSSGFIRIYYGNAPHPATQKFNGPISALLKARRYHDAVRAIESDPDVMERVGANPEAANAYGVALYFTALDNKDPEQEARALEILSLAAARGSEAAVQNLKGTEIYGPARKEYDAWQELINEHK